ASAHPAPPARLVGARQRWRPNKAMVEPVVAPGEQDRSRAPLAGPLARLLGVPGLDLQQGLAALQGKQDKYLALLRHFANEHGQDMVLLHHHLQTGDSTSATRLVHTLRGVASTLGMVELARQCLLLEQALAGDGPEPTALMTVIAGELAALHDRLGEEVPAQAPQLIPLGSQWQRDLRQQMEALLLQSDTAVIPLFEQYAAPLRLMLGPRSETLARQLKSFDFDGALLTLHQCAQADEPPTEVMP
ncbi:Hpt domain-containing protein, partial [Aeromonas media]|uniref:Hpt domain-containing protein n=1 Tax=Aeromonas media TaxID=651 RepID=UPI003D01CF9D